MDIGIIAKRYAKSLFAFASENHDEQTVYQAMLNLVNSYQKVEQLHPTLLNPVLAPEKQKAILLAASVGDGESVPVSLSRFVQLVVSHKRIEIMPCIAQSYIQIYRKSQKMLSGRLIVPSAIDAKVTNQMRNIIEKKVGTPVNIEFEVEEDPEILGGFILEYDTYRLDASLRTQFNQLRRVLN